MGLFSKEACTFCGKEVGMMHRSKLATKEYICSDCRNKTNPFARMDYTSRAAAQEQMELLPADNEWYNREVARLEAEKTTRFVVVDNTDFKLGSKLIQYSFVRDLGVFRIYCSDFDHYAYIPVLYMNRLIPYQFQPDVKQLADIRQADILRREADYVTVSVSKDSDGKPRSCELVIPYQDDCIREIKFSSDVSSEAECRPFYDMAKRINDDRRIWLNSNLSDEERKNRMQVRNLGDTAAAALKAAVKGESVEEAVKEGIETANAIEEGKVKQGFFGKLFKK